MDMTTNNNTIIATILVSIDVLVIVSSVEQHSDSVVRQISAIGVQCRCRRTLNMQIGLK